MVQNPFTIGAKDLIPPVAKAVGATASGGMGGLDDLNKIFEFLDKFIPRMKEFESTIQNLRSMDKGNPTDAPQGDDRAEGAPNMVTQLPAPVISAEAVYGKMLGALSRAQQAAPEMTLTEALEKAKEYKLMIVPEIAAALKEITG